ncbi:MAG TPA: glycosyltransferase [Ignavibacteriaceae bacterium]|nr:glycosyltransferase [Ignavibacteriaceae bacterium]
MYKKDSIKHSVLVLTYNNEATIKIAIDSILDQNYTSLEVVIGNDCSTDQTGDLLNEYISNYPGIIKLVNNKVNMGIFRNFNNLKNMVTGDVISVLAGDDYFKPGLFSSLNKNIERNNLKPCRDSFIIVYNTIHLTPTNKEKVFSNYRIRSNNMFKERLRYGLSFREVGISARLWREIEPIRTDLGYLADWLMGFDLVAKCKKFVFVNEAYSVYRLNSGIISKTKNEVLQESWRKVLPVVEKKYDSRLDRMDKLYLKYLKYKVEASLNKTYTVHLLYYYFLILNVLLKNYSKNNLIIKELVNSFPVIKKYYKKFVRN